MSEINKELFAKVRDKILRVLEAYDQRTFGMEANTPCGTRACIGGHALIEAGFCTPQQLLRRSIDGGKTLFSVNAEAARLLGLSDGEVPGLFGRDASYWPEPYGSRFDEARTPQGRALVAADYLTWIIETGKVTA